MTRLMALIGWIAVVGFLHAEVSEWAAWLAVAAFAVWLFSDELSALGERCYRRASSR